MFINDQCVYLVPAFGFAGEFLCAAPAVDMDALDNRAMDDYWCVWCGC